LCTANCLSFVGRHLTAHDVEGKRIIEVGAYDVNGSARSLVEALGPKSYLGVDIESGPGVDVVCPAEEVAQRFGAGAFDVVLTTEMLEHVRDWQEVVHNLKQTLAPGGVLIITTRSEGFPYHPYPADYWRYGRSDMRMIFADCLIEAMEDEGPEDPGIFVRARKPNDFVEVDLSGVALYSMLTSARALSAELAERQISLEESAAGLIRLQQTKTFRIAAPLRRGYSRVRSLLRI
jgi:SAM-dependent methyltransferase